MKSRFSLHEDASTDIIQGINFAAENMPALFGLSDERSDEIAKTIFDVVAGRIEKRRTGSKSEMAKECLSKIGELTEMEMYYFWYSYANIFLMLILEASGEINIARVKELLS